MFIFCRYEHRLPTSKSQGDIADTCSCYVRSGLNLEIQASYHGVSRDPKLHWVELDAMIVACLLHQLLLLIHKWRHADVFPYIVAFPSTEALYRPAMTIFLK